jgi:hypothetical protein
MPYDQFGRLIPGGAPSSEPHYQHYGQAETGGYGEATGMANGPHEGYRQALLAMPSAGQLGGPGPVPFVRYPFFPTAPFYSTNPNVGYQTRFYSQGVQYTDADYQVGSEMIRTVQFDSPCRLVAFNGSAIYYFGSPAVVASLPLGVKPNDTYLFRGEYTTGDKLHISSRLGSTVVGSDENPGEIGGTGYTIDAGASFVIGITPLIANLRIDITLVCLEMRGPRNFSR